MRFALFEVGHKETLTLRVRFEWTGMEVAPLRGGAVSQPDSGLPLVFNTLGRRMAIGCVKFYFRAVRLSARLQDGNLISFTSPS
jgi:hypothetical protein